MPDRSGSSLAVPGVLRQVIRRPLQVGDQTLGLENFYHDCVWKKIIDGMFKFGATEKVPRVKSPNETRSTKLENYSQSYELYFSVRGVKTTSSLICSSGLVRFHFFRGN